MKNFCLTLFFAYLLAACPNNCSGHGKCTENGKCECNRQTGLALNKGAFTKYTYTGADCSHRTCPLGTPFGAYQPTEKKEGDGYEGCNSPPCRRALGDMIVRFLAESQARLLVETNETTTAPAPSFVNVTKSGIYNVSNPILPEEMGAAGGTLMCRSSKTGKIAGKADVLSVKRDSNNTALFAAIRFMFNLTEVPENVDDDTEEPTTTTQGAAKPAERRRLRNLVEDQRDLDDETPTEGEKETTPTTPEPTTAAPPPPPKEETFNLQELECSVIELRKDLTTIVPEKVEISKLIRTDLSDAGESAPTLEGSSPADGVYKGIVWTGMADILDDMGFFTKTTRILEDTAPTVVLEYTKQSAKFYCNEQIDKKPVVKKYVTYVYKQKGGNDVYFIFIDQSNTPNKDAKCYLSAKPNGESLPIVNTTIGQTALKCDPAIVDEDKFDCKGFVVPDASDDDLQSVIVNGDGTYTITATHKTIGTKAMQAMLYAYSQNTNRYVFIPVPQTDDNYGDILMKLTEGAKLSIAIYMEGYSGLTDTVTVSSVIGTSFTLPKEIITESTSVPETPSGSRILAEMLESETINLPTVYTEEIFNPLSGSKLSYGTAAITVTIQDSDTKTMMECSGQGTCNRETGQCQCYPGYDGDACQRLSCPNDCSNHGRCVRVYEALEQPSVNYYAGFGNADSIYSCICDPGHRGSDCSLLECPSDIDPMQATNDKDKQLEQRDCSGRGICDYATGLCQCFDGFYGEACQRASTYA